jgi:hypothetical protein
MGYRGKLAEQQQARQLRGGLPLAEIAARLDVSKSSVSLWVRDVDFEALLRSPPRGRRRTPNALQRRRQAEVDRLLEGRERVGRLSEREFLVVGVALYAGEGAKRDGAVKFANTKPRMIAFYCAWLRRFFDIDESRLRVRLYLPRGARPGRRGGLLVGADRDSAHAVLESLPGGPRPDHPPCQACAWLRQHRLQLLPDPPQYHGARCRPSLATTSLRGSSTGRAAAC